MKRFDYFLRDTYKNSNTTIHANMKFLKTIFATLVVFLMLSNSSCMGTQKTQTANDGSIPVRVVESYGSVCCPRDPLHDHHLKNFVKNFNDKHKTHISEMYRLIRGREGEGYLYLTLNELTPVWINRLAIANIAFWIPAGIPSISITFDTPG